MGGRMVVCAVAPFALACASSAIQEGPTDASAPQKSPDGESLPIPSAVDPETGIIIVQAQNPLSPTWNAIWAKDDKHVYFGGDKGAFMQWDGERLVNLPRMTAEDIVQISGSSPHHIWVTATNGVALHYDGSTWSKRNYAGAYALPTGETVGLFGMSGSIRNYSTVSHAEIVAGGKTSEPISIEDTYANVRPRMWGNHAREIWLALTTTKVGNESYVLRFEGEAWNRHYLDFGYHATSIHGSWHDNVWFVGYGYPTPRECTVYQYKGIGIDQQCNGLPKGKPMHMTAVFADSRTDVWMTSASRELFRWDGSIWSSVAVPKSQDVNMMAVWKVGNSVWLAGERGVIMRIDR